VKRWVVAIVALVAGVGVSAALLVAVDPSRGLVNAWVAARDIANGTQLDSGSIVLAKVDPGNGQSLLFSEGDAPALMRLRTTHDLLAGQLIQRSDVAASNAAADVRLVYVPLKDAPPVVSGSKVDLLVIDGPPDRLVVEPFALKVQVYSAASGGLVLLVPSQDAGAFVYAAASMELAAVVAEPGAADGVEVPISTVQQAIDVASHP